MTPSCFLDPKAVAASRRAELKNVLTALATGAALLATGLFAWNHYFLGLALGLVYSNGFEYVYHRFVLHDREGRLSNNHQLHHSSFGQADEPRNVTFGGSPIEVGIVIVLNSVPFALFDWLGAGIGAGVVTGFVVYFTAFEEMHWRMHLGWLPNRLEWMRLHHFAHHRGEEGRYNVFLPLCDRLFAWTLPRRRAVVIPFSTRQPSAQSSERKDKAA